MHPRSCLAPALSLAATFGLTIAAHAAKPPPPPPPEYHYITLGDSSYQRADAFDVAEGVAVGNLSFPRERCLDTGSQTDRAAIFSQLESDTPTPWMPLFVDTPGDYPSHSVANAVTRDGTLVVGTLWTAQDPPNECDLPTQSGVAWVRGASDSDWDREVVEPLSAGLRGVEHVNGTAVAVGSRSGGEPTAWWRQADGSWLARPMPRAGSPNSSVVGSDIQIDGLAVSGSGQAAMVWDCSGTDCLGPQLLPATGLVEPGGVAWDINDAGDVVGSGRPTGSTYTRALFWDRTVSGAWANAVALPDAGFGGAAYASEVVGGVVTVVGRITPGRKGGSLPVRWRLTGTGWSAPRTIVDIDDSTGPLEGGVVLAISDRGDIAGQYAVEVPFP